MLNKDGKTLDTKKVTRYGLRKLSVGLTGAAIGAFLALSNPTTQEVKADTVPDDPDQVNVEPSGEKAAKEELAKAQQNLEPAKAAANQASAKLATKAAAVKAAPAKTATTTQAQANNQSASTQSQNTQTENKETPTAATSPKANTVKAVPEQASAKATSRATKSVKTTRKAKAKTKAKATNKKVGKLASRSAFSGVSTKVATGDEHTKIVQRDITWYTVDSKGNKQKLTSISQQIKFGQKWNQTNDGPIEYVPWDQDDRKETFKAYTNDDLFKNLQDQVNAGNMSQTDYNSINNIFKNGKVSSNGAPESDPVGPLSKDLSYEVDITTEEKVKIVNVSVIYLDLDSNNKVLTQNSYQASPGKQIQGQADYNKNISDLESKGYKYDPNNENLPSGYKKLANKGLINVLPEDELGDQTNFTYYVGLHHDIRTYNPGEKNPFTNKDDDANLVKNVTQTIKYTGTNTSIPDNVQTVKFSRQGQVDMVTGATKYLAWDKTSDQYKDVTSPTVTGYTPDQDVIKGSQVTPNSSDTTKTVTYATADQMRDAIVHYRYDSWDSNKQVFADKNRKVVAKENSSGGLDFDKDTFNQDIIQKDGYTASVMHTEVKGGVIHAYVVYVKNPENNFVVHFIDQDNNNQKIPGVNDVTGTNVIGKPVEKPAGVDDIIKQLQDKGYEVVSDPFDNPPTAVDGKQEANYVLKHKKVPVNPITNRKEVVHFVDQDGKQIAPDKTQSASFTHSGVTDLVTGETTWTGWSDNKSTDAVDVPVVNGYIATQKQVPSQVLTPDQDIEITVKYNQIGKLVPVDDNGNPIPGASQPSYINDPTDPTKVKPDQKVPDVSGYTPEVSTVTPTDPIKNTPVKYHKDKTPAPAPDQTSLGVVVHDDDTGQDLNDYHWTSGSVTPGNKVDYDWNKVKQDLIDHGYVVVQEPNIPTYYGQSAQVVTIHVKHGIVHVSPDKPQTAGNKINKGTATWPDASQYQHDRKYTVHFVDSNGKQLAKDEVQTMRFGRDLQIDAVTGKILNPDAKWEPENKEYAGISADKINGYKVNGKSKNGVALVNGVLPGPNAVDSDLSDSIVYTADDQVPNDPGDGGEKPGKPNNDLGTPAKPASPAAPAKAEPVKAAAKPEVHKSSALPQTGSDSKQELALSVLGITMMLLALGKSPLKRKH